MKLNPYLTYDGQCREAFDHYQRILGGTVEMMTHGDSPVCDEIPSAWHDRIMHACLVAGDNMLMGSDAPPQHFEQPAGFAVALAFDEPAEAERVFHALAEGGVVRMPMQETFWAARFGMVTDRFGIPWVVNGGLVAGVAGG